MTYPSKPSKIKRRFFRVLKPIYNTYYVVGSTIDQSDDIQQTMHMWFKIDFDTKGRYYQQDRELLKESPDAKYSWRAVSKEYMDALIANNYLEDLGVEEINSELFNLQI